jgi:hypothetical protein
MRVTCRCPLCWVVSWVAGQLSDPAPRPAVPTADLSLEDLVRTWSAPRIGSFMHDLRTADMLPGFDRGTQLALFAKLLREKESTNA